MLLEIVSTGSEANSYILTAGKQSLILDAGVSFRKLLPHVGNVRAVQGCLVTHLHSDHARAAVEYSKRGIKVFMTENEKHGLGGDGIMIRPCASQKPFTLGEFSVLPFATEHDTPEPVGFLIRYNPTGETLLYATDTCYLRWKFPGVHYWLIESNYIDEIADKQVADGALSPVLRERLVRSHLSLRRLKECLSANDLTPARKIVLIHLSSQRSDAVQMQREVQELTGVETLVAEADMKVSLDLTPF